MKRLLTPGTWRLRLQAWIALCMLVAAATLLLAEWIARRNDSPAQSAAPPPVQPATPARTPDEPDSDDHRQALGWALGLGALGVLTGRWVLGRLSTPDESRGGMPPRRNLAASAHGMGARRRGDLRHRPPTLPPSSARPEASAPQAGPEAVHQDRLTGLWSRAYLEPLSARLQKDIDTREFCLLRLDLDGFQGIRERCGREAGDQVLVQTARRLRHLAREEDFVFHLGTGEFLLLLPCPRREAGALARTMATRVLADVQRPMAYRTLNNLRVGCSIGAAVWRGGEALSETLQHAHEALLAARQGGRGHFRHYALMPAGSIRQVEAG